MAKDATAGQQGELVPRGKSVNRFISFYFILFHFISF
jgi:hypothetical protein